MPISDMEEPRALSGLQQNPMNVPFKKRRFPIIRSESPPEEEMKPCASEDSESKNNEDSGGINEKLSAIIARNVESSISCEVSKIPERAEAEVFGSVSSLQGSPCFSSGLIHDATEKINVPLKENTEGDGGLGTSKGRMNVELSVGLEESLGSAIAKQKDEDVSKSGNKSDPSLVSLSSCKETTVMHGKDDSGANQVNSELCSDRSNWDLNTTMDVWSGSTNSDGLTSGFTDNTEFSKVDDCHNSEYSLTVSATAGLSLNKGNNVLDEQPKLNLFPGFTFDMPCVGTDSLRDHSAMSRKFFSSGPNLSLQLFQQPASSRNLIRPSTVKSEPIDRSSELNSSLGTSCSSNIGLSKTISVKREHVENHSLETAMCFREGALIQNPSVVTTLPSSVDSQELVNRRSIKSELVQEASQESCMYKAVEAHKNAGRFMQHQESCVSSSVLPFPLMPPEFYRRVPSTSSEQTMDGDLSNHSEQNFLGKESKGPENVLGRNIDAIISKPSGQNGKQTAQCKVEKSMSNDSHVSKVAQVDEHSLGFGESANIVADLKEKTSLLGETLQKTSSYSDCGPQENHVVPSTSKGRKICTKADEYEDGEIRDPARCLAGEVPILGRKKIDQNNPCDIKSSQLSAPSIDHIVTEHDSAKNAALSENQDENHEHPIEESLVAGRKLSAANNAVQKVTEDSSDVGVDEERSISTAAEKQLDLSVNKDAEQCSVKGVPNDLLPSNESQGIITELENNAPDGFDADVSSRKKDCTLTVPEASPNCNDIARDFIHTAAKESKNTTTKSRIINLPRSSTATTFGKAKFASNRLLTSNSVKERDFNFDREIMPRGRRDETYTRGVNRFAKDEIHDQPFRSSRPNFRQKKGMYDSDQNFASEAYNRPHYDRARHEHASNDNLPSFRRRRPSPGDIDVSLTRGMQKHRRISRNFSTNSDDGSTFVGFRHADRFLQRLSSDNGANAVYSHRQPLFDEIDGQMSRGNRKFSPIQRNGFPRMRSKSPIRSRTRSPGPWTTTPPRRRRMGRRSPHLQLFRPNARSSVDSLGTREMVDGDEFADGPMQQHSNSKFLGDVYCTDERRKFVGNRGPFRSFRPSYNDNDNDDDDENFQFPTNDGPRLYSYRPEFVERSENVREIRDFDGHVKQHDRDYRPSGRVWQDDELTEGVKRRRY